MKILFVTHYAAMMGANRSLLTVIQFLQEKGSIDIEVVLPEEGEFSKILDQQHIPFHIEAFYPNAHPRFLPNFWKSPWLHYKSQQSLKRLVSKFKDKTIDFVYSNSSVICFGAALADELGVKHIWHIREFAQLHYKAVFYPSTAYFKNYLRKASATITVSKALHQGITKGLSPKNYTVYNGVISSQELKHLQSEVPQPRNTIFSFLCIGMIHPSKDQLEAIKAFELFVQKYPNAELKIVGSGRRFYLQRLKQYVRQHQLADNVQFISYVPNPKELFRNCDVLLVPFKHEGMGRVTVEGMCYAKPVIGHQSGGTPELFIDKKHGYIYKNGPEEMMHYMEQLYLSEENCLTMGKAGQTHVKAAFVSDDYAQRIYSILEELF